jgi:DNA-binding CsgD family transcriptional regulator
MDNTAFHSGGGLHTGSRGTFKKTGGIIYGRNAPVGLRNMALEGNILNLTFPRTYGYAVCLAAVEPKFFFRNDTVNENDNLSYIGSARGNGVFGYKEKWDTSQKANRRTWFFIILSDIAFGVGAIIIFTKIVVKKRLEKILQIAAAAPEVDLEGYKLTEREQEVCKLLLTKLGNKQIADILGIAIPTVSFHANNLYRKLGIENRPELFVKLLKKE